MADSGAKKASEEFFQHLISSSESCVDDKVCVVGIFGKDNIGYKSKAVHLNGTIGKEVFKIDFLDGTFKKKDTDEFSCDINVYHDVEQRIIYLHLVSVYDVSRLLQLCKQAPQDAQNAATEHAQYAIEAKNFSALQVFLSAIMIILSVTNALLGSVQSSGEASHQYWMSHEFYYACALLFLFSVSHIVVLLHPSQTFDLNYIRLFRTLASTRHQLLPQISQLLSGVDGIPDIWRQTGRPCIPRLVCSMKQRVPFMDPSQVSGKSQDTYASKTKGKQQSITPQKKLQHAVEDQLYSIMRKARLLGSLSSSSLFTVNSSHAFVHMQPCSTNFDPVAVLLNTLAKPAINTKWVEKSPLLKNSKFLKREFSESGGNSEARSTDDVLFRDYLKQQIDLLMTGDGGRDGVAEGRRGTHVEVPSCRLWARVSLALYEFFLTPKNDLIAPLTAMASNLDLDMKFSEARCRKAIPVARSAYLENLPSHYTQNVHLNQLSQALRVFSLHARGPAFEHYAAQFQDECNKVWMNGRQLCEERSLTGRHCVYPYHRVPAEGEMPSDPVSEESKELGVNPCKPHSSRITSVSACNCGRIQDHREDPFDLKTANMDFFKILESKCCFSLVHLFFPFHPIALSSKNSHKTSTEISDEAPLLEMPSEIVSFKGEEVKSGEVGGEGHVGDETSNSETPAVQVAPTTGSIPIPNSGVAARTDNLGSLGHSVSSTYGASGYQSTLEMMSHEGSEFRSMPSEFKSVVSVGIPGEISMGDSQDVLSAVGEHVPGVHSFERFSSRDEMEQIYLETMLNSDSPPGILPRFPSWSLCRLGSASAYNPAKGLDQPGFFPNSNYLLAWDIPLLNESQSDLTSQFDGKGKHLGSKQMTEEAWPTLNELPSAGSNVSSLPLHQALTYARRQCSDYKANTLPLISSAVTGKGASGASRQRGRAAREGALPTVRAYIGQEYECPRGHRFICSGPDKMVKATSSGHVKETAQKLVTSDMPLYFPCPCRSSKPLMAQMMRVFIVTPDSPILVTLNPRVQPSLPPCPVFYPGVNAGVTIPPGSFCVLRLPYVYVSDVGPILPPGDSQPLLSCRVLKGLFSVMGLVQETARENLVEGRR